jgi:protein TonB
MPLNMESWLKDKDYPKEARRAGAHGTSSFRLEIDRKGRVTACTITGSSGTPILDETTCSVLLRRARFSPAEDRDGNPIAAHYSNRFRWSLSE